MFSLLKSFAGQYKTIATSSFFLSVVDGIKLLLPFVAMPYIIRVCGTENYGKIIFAQTVIFYLSAFVNFGMNIFAIKEFTEHINEQQRLSCLMSSFIFLRIILTIMGFAALIIMIVFIPLFREMSRLMLFSYIMVVAEALSVTVYYQAIEKMFNISVIHLIAIVLYLPSLFLFVRDTQDYEFVPLLQSLGLLIAVLIGMLVMCTRYQVKLVLPEYSEIKRMFFGSLSFALSTFSSFAGANIAKLLAGVTLGMYELALLDMAQKIYEAALIPARIVEQAIYPHTAKSQDKKFARRTFWFVGVFALLCAAVMALGTPVAIKFLGGGKLDAAIGITMWFCGRMILAMMSHYTGIPLLVAFGYGKSFNQSIFVSTGVMIALYAVVYLTGYCSMPMLIALMILSDVIIFVHRMIYCIKYKLLF